MTFTAPQADQLLALEVNAGVGELGVAADLAAAIVGGIADFAQGEWAPLSRIGDTEGARLENGRVHLPAGYAQAYQAYVAQGWGSVSGPEDFGGQGLPGCLSACVQETLGAANLGFTLLPILTVGAIEAIGHHGSEAQKARYLRKVVSGEWSGTMNLTEPQAGSDVGALRTAATPVDDGPHKGRWLIRGTKIFITWGEHELAENIVHLVLARTPGAPAGSRGISLFVVPRVLVNDDGSLGERNDVQAVGLEHKLGIHASPTCVMSYGDNGACLGELIGAENEGLKCMFTMMNSARINVGSQGVQVAEAALQQAVAYARDRIQSPRAGSPDRTPVAIIEHPDVRRMVLRMRALTEGARALLYYTCGQADRGNRGDAAAKARAEVLVPLIKAWGTEVGCEVASLGVQVHGGAGYIEETGAARHFRDARITPIYEGTNGIQAADFVTRKLGMENGAVLLALLDEAVAGTAGAPHLAALAADCAAIARWMLADASLDDRLAGSVPFTTMCAVAIAGWQLGRQAEAIGSDPPDGADRGSLARTKPVTARFFAERIAPEAAGLKASATAGASLLYALDAAGLAS